MYLSKSHGGNGDDGHIKAVGLAPFLNQTVANYAHQNNPSNTDQSLTETGAQLLPNAFDSHKQRLKRIHSALSKQYSVLVGFDFLRFKCIR
jgi:hypothetical protein